jgi:hypothetical protein
MYLGMPKWKKNGAKGNCWKYTITTLPLLDGYVRNTQQEIMYHDM